MPHAPDTAGYAAFNAGGGGSETLIPLLPGSRGYADPNFQNEETASPIGAPINYTQGGSTPYYYLRTYPFPAWFGYGFVYPMFARNAFGQLPSMGRFQWRYGNQPARQWVASKVDRIVLTWGTVGTPVLAEMLVLPYDYAIPAANSLSTDPTVAMSDPYASQDVKYQNTLDSVWGGRLEIGNRLSPCEEGNALPSPDGIAYPPDYWPDTLDVRPQIVQTTAAWLILGNESTLRVRFYSPSRTQSLTFTANLTGPLIEETVTGRIALVSRSYKGIQAGPGSFMLALD